MTIDGSGDDAIQIQGLTEKYTFTDADGGPEGAESEADEDAADLADVAESVAEGVARSAGDNFRTLRCQPVSKGSLSQPASF